MFNTIGIINKLWPITMAAWVYNNPQPPNGPCRLNKPNISKPTTTVGNAIRVFRILCSTDLPGNLLDAINNPSGIHKVAAMATDNTEILSEVQTTKYNSSSSDRIS